MLKAIKVSKESITKSLKREFFGVIDASVRFLVERKQINKAESHDNVADLFFIISGKTTFICNGKLIDSEKSPNDQNTLIAEKIKDGTEYRLKGGDWLFIPENCPHQRITLKKATFLVIKIPKK